MISPFLDGEFLRSVTRRRRHSVLISRKEALLTVSPDAVRSFERVYAFRSALEPEPEDTDESLTLLAGLHAKVFVVDDGWNARVAVGVGELYRGGARQSASQYRIHGRARGQEESLRHRRAIASGSGGRAGHVQQPD